MNESAPEPTTQPEVTGQVRPGAHPLQWVLDQRWPLANVQIILIILIIIGGRLAFDFSQRIIEGQQKIAQEHILENHIDVLKRDQDKLQADKQYFSSEAYVESWTHDEGKMIRDGEKLVVPVYKGEPIAQKAITVTSLIVAQQEQLAPWQVWWILFFDGPPPFSSNNP